MKRRIFCLTFYCFFRLQIYEAIAAIFWYLPDMFNSSQMKFVAIILVLSVFFVRFFAWPIFCLTLLTVILKN